MKKIFSPISVLSMILIAFVSCTKENEEYDYDMPTKPYEMVNIQNNTSIVLWDAEDFNFDDGNEHYLQYYADLEKLIESQSKAGAACSSWRNGRYHGRNLDWYQSDYGCLIIQMPKSSKVKHASVALLNGNSAITQAFISRGYIDKDKDKYLPSVVVDGINDAGVAVNINIVTHTPGTKYIKEEGNLSSQCVVRYVLDNAGSVDEAISLLEKKVVRQSIVAIAGDETHYMISDKNSTAVVEFNEGVMTVTRFNQGKDGWVSAKGTPAIMTNLYNFAIEQWDLGTDEFFDHEPLAMGVERWNTIKGQYPKSANSIKDNFDIAQSVWYFKGLLKDKNLWYTENAVPTAYGKDAEGWYYKKSGERIACDGWESAQKGFWEYFMEKYWKNYEENFANKPDPHISGNEYWETSHTVIYDLDAKKGYLYPFENFYSKDGEPIVISLPR